MSTRIQKIFQNKNKKLLTFTTGGDPDLKTCIKIIEIILNNGADIIEIGMPFSDPMADGPTIQLSSNRAIREEITLEHFVDHLDYVCQIAGNSLHASIGGDTDGQGGRDGAPYEIDTVADYQKVGDILEKRGYKESDIENILYLNWKRFFEKNLPKS